MSGIRSIGVVGAGLMGAGIAQTTASAGFETLLRDVDEGALRRARAGMEKSTAKFVEKGQLTAQARDAALARVRTTTDLGEMKGVDLVIEAVPEDAAMKIHLFKELNSVCPYPTAFASNTSSISITQLASGSGRPDRFVGLHFFNPVPLMPLVEVIRGAGTSSETYAAALGFVRHLGKETVEARDVPGFLVNLLLVPFLLDAVRALERGVAGTVDIDRGMVLGCGHPMGPLTLLDFVGLDTVVRIAEIMRSGYGEERYAAPALLRRMVAAGSLGRKKRQGVLRLLSDASGSGRASVRSVCRGFLPACHPDILPLVLLSLFACNPNTTRPRVVPFPEDASIEVHAKLPAATERLIRALTVDSIPIAMQSTRDGWVETPWLSAETLRPTDARPIGPQVVRIRGWVNPAKEGFSTIIVEAAYRPFADPSLPGRELERPVPKDHPVQIKIDSMLARIPKGRSATATLVPVPDSVSQKPDSLP